MTLRALLALFIAAGSASAQELIGGSSGGATGGGGAPTDATYWLGSANGSLSAEIVVNDIASLEAAISAYDFNDASNLTTGDIAAARMATNWGTAGTSACATTSGVMVDDGATVGCSSTFTFDGNVLKVRSGSQQGIAFDSALYIKGNVSGYAIFATGSGQSGGKFQVDGVDYFQFGGSQTALVQDQTATTGDTSFKVLSGAGESGNCQEWDDDGTGALASVDCETGNSVFSNVTLGTTGATFYGPSASEPIDCTTSNDGSMYFDTDDQKLCICANDGTDDEWLHSDNYGHVVGHCSI